MQKLERVANYNLVRKLGSGSFGEVYLGEDKKNSSVVAIKLEPVHTNSPVLRFESNILRCLCGVVGIPKYRWHGTHSGYNILVMDLLGPSVEQLFQYCNQKFSLKTVLMVADQLLDIIQHVHKKNIIHRDIKPDNLLFGLNRSKYNLHLIDFGLSKKYRFSQSDQHIPYETGKPLVGTARYCSINTHLSVGQSRRDDLETIGYVLMYLLRGSLPWQNLKAIKCDKRKMIGEKKIATTVKELCDGFPLEFSIYLRSVKSLDFEEEPKYAEYRNLFMSLFNRLGYKMDNAFDWIILHNNNKKRH